jgi:hypothetical protein
LRHTAIRHIHLFASRTEAFKADRILQENVIVQLKRDAEQAEILISNSTNGDMNDYRVDPAYFFDKPFLGFENHLNVFHSRKTA